VSFVDVRALEASGAASADLGGSVLGAGSDGRTARVGGGAAGSVDATGASTASRSGDVEAGVATDLARSASSAPDRPACSTVASLAWTACPSAASVTTDGCVIEAASVPSP